MLRDGACEIESAVEVRDWRDVDYELRSIAKRRAALDAEEAKWLREAERLRIWREVGCGSLLEYMERRLGYKPHTAVERLRVALAIEQMPAMEVALETGELPFTAIRELTRVATEDTADAWLEAGRGKSVHEIEQLVSGHRRGDLPSDPADPDLEPRTIKLELMPETYALLREARNVLANERGHHIDDNELVAPMCRALLGDGGSRATYLTTVRRCDGCGAASQEAGGRMVAIDAAAAERAECDTDHLEADGSITHVIPAKVRRLVRDRDGGKCRVPRCRATRNLEFHHIQHREHGGDHAPDNLILLCNGHHDDHHRGTLAITGTATDLHVERKVESQLELVSRQIDARGALTTMGFKTHEAKARVEHASAHVGLTGTFETFMRSALRFLN